MTAETISLMLQVEVRTAFTCIGSKGSSIMVYCSKMKETNSSAEHEYSVMKKAENSYSMQQD